VYKKILFLDFDGVILPHKNNDLNSVNSKLELLNLIIDKTNSNVIIHSSLKYEVQKILLNSSLKNKDKIIGTTLDTHVIKGGQIKNTIKKYNIDKFLVVDDDDTYICSEKHNYINKSNFYHINGDNGLTEEDADKIIATINNL